MKREKSVIALLFLLFITTSCSPRQTKYDNGSDSNLTYIEAKHVNFNNNAGLSAKPARTQNPNNKNDVADPQNQAPGPAKSGQTKSVPWENDAAFKTAQAANDCKELMAAYKTVLKDPLPGEEFNVHLAARYLSGTIVKPDEVFSQNLKVGPYTQDRGFQKGPTYIGTQLTTTIGGGVCKIASTLYNVTVLSNLQIVERHFHSMPVPYVPYGQDATVSYGVKDFKFRNNTSFPIMIWAQGIENTLYIAFYGKEKPPKVEWHHELLKVYEASRIYRTNPNLPLGMEKIVLEGMNGGIVNSWVSIEDPDGTLNIKQLGKSYYNPMTYIIEKGG